MSFSLIIIIFDKLLVLSCPHLRCIVCVKRRSHDIATSFQDGNQKILELLMGRFAGRRTETCIHICLIVLYILTNNISSCAMK